MREGESVHRATIYPYWSSVDQKRGMRVLRYQDGGESLHPSDLHPDPKRNEECHRLPQKRINRKEAKRVPVDLPQDHRHPPTQRKQLTLQPARPRVAQTLQRQKFIHLRE